MSEQDVQGSRFGHNAHLMPSNFYTSKIVGSALALSKSTLILNYLCKMKMDWKRESRAVLHIGGWPCSMASISIFFSTDSFEHKMLNIPVFSL